MGHSSKHRQKRVLRMTVKVQRSIVTSNSVATVLVYNKDRSIIDEFDMPEELAKIMGDELKIYCIAEYDRKTKHLELYPNERRYPEDW